MSYGLRGSIHAGHHADFIYSSEKLFFPAKQVGDPPECPVRMIKRLPQLVSPVYTCLAVTLDHDQPIGLAQDNRRYEREG